MEGTGCDVKSLSLFTILDQMIGSFKIKAFYEALL